MRQAPSFVRTILAAVIVSVFLPALGLAQEQPADRVKQIIASVVDAYGGREAVADIKSVVAKGTISDFMKETQGDYARYLARPDKLRIEIMAGRPGELRILNGSRGWRGSSESLAQVQGPPLQAMIYQYTYLDLPMGLVDGSYAVSYDGTREFKGRMVTSLIVEAKGTPKVRIYVDPESSLIVRAACRFDMGKGFSELSTEYEDFRTVGKTQFPFRLVNYAGDTKLSVITLSDIQLNPHLPESTFTPNLK